MNEVLLFMASVDWASLMIGAGAVASALGFGLGTPLMIAGKTLKEMKKVVDKTPISNEKILKIAKREGLKKAEKEIQKITKPSLSKPNIFVDQVPDDEKPL